MEVPSDSIMGFTCCVKYEKRSTPITLSWKRRDYEKNRTGCLISDQLTLLHSIVIQTKDVSCDYMYNHTMIYICWYNSYIAYSAHNRSKDWYCGKPVNMKHCSPVHYPLTSQIYANMEITVRVCVCVCLRGIATKHKHCIWLPQVHQIDRHQCTIATFNPS